MTEYENFEKHNLYKKYKDLEKENEYLNKELQDYQFNYDNIKKLEKENAELKERLKGFENGEVAWQGDMDRTIEQNLHLKKEIGVLKARMDRMKKFLPAYMLGKYLEEDK